MKQVVRKNIAEANHIKKEPSARTLIIDGNSLLKLSLVDKRVNSRGEEYGAVLVFFWQIKKRLDTMDFNYVYVFWDGDNSGQLRYNLYPDYKSNRDKHYRDSTPQSDYEKKLQDFYRRTIDYYKNKGKKAVVRNETDDESFQRQRLIIQNMLECLFVRQAIFDDVEGDDLIAYYVNNMDKDEQVLIFSGDKDITQLVSDNVSVYFPQLKQTITKDNHIQIMGYTHENVVLKKIFCGDQSDAIKGIKGMGEKTFFSLYPEAKTQRLTVEDVLNKTKGLIEERIKNKQKPLKVTENVVNKVTDGCQGEHIYEVNERIIDLSSPMLTDEAKEGLDALMYAPIDPDGRGFNGLYEIITDNDMSELLDEDKFSLLFSSFERIVKNEKKIYEKSCESQK